MRHDPLLRALRLLRLPRGRTVFAIAAGIGAAASALALAGLSAWLIARAWQMPPVLDLSVAVVTVRALGISRGIFRYVERLAAHDIALRGMAVARETSYARMAAGDLAAVTSLKRGDLLTRTGADVDAVGAVVVRGVLPIAAALVLGPAAVIALLLLAPPAGVVAAMVMLLAGVLAPWLGARRAREAEQDALHDNKDQAEYTVTALEHAAELRVAGRLEEALANAHAAAVRSARATDRAAGSTAFALAATPLGTGVTALAALLIGVAAYPADPSPTSFAVLVLLPLAAFEAIAMLPTAAATLTRGRFAATRLLSLLDSAGTAHGAGTTDVPVDGALAVSGPMDLILTPGSRIAITGPSGAGKTTLLRTLAGLQGSDDTKVTVGGVAIAELDPRQLRSAVTFFAEDAHIFGTTVLENLRVADGMLTPAAAETVLARVGLGPWLATLPAGLDTVLEAGERALSGGQRRRLLLARALVSPARVLLLDEPTEHLEAEAGADMLRALLDRDSGLVAADRTVAVVTHQLPPDHQAGEVIELTARQNDDAAAQSYSAPDTVQR